MPYKIYIDGQEGTTGLKISRRLQARDDLEVLSISESERKKPEARLRLMDQADITFLCLPDSASREIIEKANEKFRILDTSTAHRTDPAWVYGFPELLWIQRDLIRKSNRVAVPGCHATGFISLVKPLVSRQIIDKEYPLVCHSLTGYSGGGKGMIGQYEEENRPVSLDGPRQYSLDQNHKHLAEMVAATGISNPPAFHPTVADYYSGMLVTVTLHSRLLKKALKPSKLRQVFIEYYQNQNVIQVRSDEEKPADGFMDANARSDNDGLEIYVLGSEEHITLMARYDNLGKGASGAAVQCMNIMLGLPENKGLVL